MNGIEMNGSSAVRFDAPLTTLTMSTESMKFRMISELIGAADSPHTGTIGVVVDMSSAVVFGPIVNGITGRYEFEQPAEPAPTQNGPPFAAFRLFVMTSE